MYINYWKTSLFSPVYYFNHLFTFVWTYGYLYVLYIGLKSDTALFFLLTLF